MFETENLIEIVSGRKRGISASAIRIVLGMLSPVYGWAITRRNRRFDRAETNNSRGLIKCVKVPVISIGNLTTGGTGKTPLVIWLAGYLRERGLRVAIVSRGYGAANLPESHDEATCPASEPPELRNDEAMEMEFRLPGIPHLQNPDRYLMAQTAIETFGSDVILLDDGFQHRQLRRDLDIVLVDATHPFGFDRLLPSGLLREPVTSLCRADLVVVTRCELVDAETRNRIRDRIRRENASVLIVETRTRTAGWLQSDGKQFAIAALQSTPVFLFCAIGNPTGFQQTIAALNLQVCGREQFADHHVFTAPELESVAANAKSAGATALVCTHKDLVKVSSDTIGGLPVFALLIDIEFLTGQSEFEEIVLRAGRLETRD